MTETKTDTESVERLAGAVDRHQSRKARAHEANPRYAKPDDRYASVAATLRALAAERDRLRHELEASEALVADLRGKLDDAHAVIKRIVVIAECGEKAAPLCMGEIINRAKMVKMVGRKDG